MTTASTKAKHPSRSVRAALSESFVSRIRPDKDFITDYFDLRMRNLSLRVSPPTDKLPGTFSWRLGYRRNNQQRILTIGRWPEWSAKAALSEAQEIKVLLDRLKAQPGAQWRDPRETLRPQTKPEPAQPAVVDTVEKMAARYIATLNDRSTAHRLAVSRYFERFIIPVWGKLDVRAVSRRQVVDLLDEVRVANGPIASNRLGSTISAWFSFLTEAGIAGASPATALRKSVERPREQVLTVPQLARVWLAAGTLGHPVAGFIKTLILTATRRDEAAGLPRSEVDDGVWLLPGSRNKSRRDHKLVLPPLARQVLEECPHNGAFYFSASGKRPLSSFSTVKQNLDAAIARQPSAVMPENWTFHDIRRSAATHAAGLGISVDIVERLLNHSQQKLAATYNKHPYVNEIAAALRLWSNCLGDALEAAQDPDAAEVREAAE